ncbi:MAG: hypothetical protein ABIO40_09710 [Devosia sp.]
MANSPTKSSGAAQQTGGTDFNQTTLRQDADSLVGEAKDAAKKLASEATNQANELADEAKARIADAADKAKGLASEQKDLLASQIGGVADAMKRAADDLEASNGASAGYARTIADNANQLSSLIRENDVDRLMQMAQDFGRRQPVAFMGAAALLGFAASRFLRASASRPQPAIDDNYAEDYQTANSTYQDSSSSGLPAGGL